MVRLFFQNVEVSSKLSLGKVTNKSRDNFTRTRNDIHQVINYIENEDGEIVEVSRA
jgi:hypothetical protein